MNNEKTIREPLFHIVKRGSISVGKTILIKAIAILIGLLVAGLIFFLVYGTSFIDFYYQIINGNFIIPGTFSTLLKDTALLLGVGIALIPAFKMKFWNLGGNGQVLMGALSACACIFYFGGKVSEPLLILIMLISSILFGGLWALIPALFKANFKTNETLFTLMMNYIAAGLINFFISMWVKSGSGVLGTLDYGYLPIIFNDSNALTVLVIAVIAVLVTIYIKYTKHGYELQVVGESENTAKYVGINVKKVVVRTLILSGVICGIIGFLLVGAIDHSVSENTAMNLGFTAIIAVWIANMNPITTVFSSFGIVLLQNGIAQAQTAIGINTDEISSMVIGRIYFIIIGSDFFITYLLKIRSNKKGDK